MLPGIRLLPGLHLLPGPRVRREVRGAGMPVPAVAAEQPLMPALPASRS